jgi:hypothetical protein
MTCIVLSPKGTQKNTQLPATLKTITDATPAVIGQILRRATVPEFIGVYNYDGGILQLWGYKTGRANTENKTELPPPHDKILLFSDAVLIWFKNSAATPFATVDYEKWYKIAFGGFEDIEDTDDEEEDDDEEEEDEVESDVESEPAEEAEGEVEAEADDEEESSAPVRIVKAPVKRKVQKRLNAWYNLPELTAEEYT